MNDTPAKSLRILFIGPEFHGSDSGGLARALRRNGHVLLHVDPDRIIPHFRQGFWGKVMNRLGSYLAIRELEKEVLRLVPHFAPHFTLVFKGDLVAASVLKALKKQNIYLMNYYPDVSVFTHGPLIPQCLPLYDYVFTAKSYGVGDLKDCFNITACEFLSHGYGPELHRSLPISEDEISLLGADVSFIGTWSPKKAAYLAHLPKFLPAIDLRIWGNQWESAGQSILRPHIMGIDVVGDLYPMAIQCSKINLSLLSEKRRGASSGDQVTSRSFHIPASAGFMLHERTDEILRYFRENIEVACFATPQELVEKIQYYLKNDEERDRIRLAGHRRCLDEYGLNKQARAITEHYYDRVRRQRLRSQLDIETISNDAA